MKNEDYEGEFELDEEQMNAIVRFPELLYNFRTKYPDSKFIFKINKEATKEVVDYSNDFKITEENYETIIKAKLLYVVPPELNLPYSFIYNTLRKMKEQESEEIEVLYYDKEIMFSSEENIITISYDDDTFVLVNKPKSKFAIVLKSDDKRKTLE